MENHKTNKQHIKPLASIIRKPYDMEGFYSNLHDVTMVTAMVVHGCSDPDLPLQNN